MDCESGIKQRQSSFSWSHLVIAGTFVLALLAFMMASVAFLHTQGEARPGDSLSVGGNQDEEPGDKYGSDRDSLLNEELEIDDTAVSMQPTRRRANSNQDYCSSEYSANSSVKPSAHIVAGSLPISRPVPAPVWTGALYSVLSQQWLCQPQQPRSVPMAYVKGGMSFNRTTGFLTVPVSGVYFVYSQVHLELVGAVNKLVHRVVTMCAPGQQCSTHFTIVMDSELVTTPTGPGKLRPSYQGGLFSLKKGQRIGVVVRYSRGIDPGEKFSYDTNWIKSFMGAFLVE